jgi:putative hydrolase of HD superfamily
MPANAEFIASFLKFLTVAEKLKCVERDNLLSNGKLESVASHCWMMGLMAILLAPKLEKPVNVERALKLIVVHDLAEAIAGDLPLWKALKDPRLKEKKDKDEANAMEKIKSILPDESTEEIIKLWQEYEERKTPEGKFVKGIDKLEAFFQSHAYHDLTYWGVYDDIYYTVALEQIGCKKHYEYEPVFMEIAKQLMTLSETRMRKVGLDPEKYRTIPEQKPANATA